MAGKVAMMMMLILIPHGQSTSIIKEYRRRAERGKHSDGVVAQGKTNEREYPSTSKSNEIK
ncbi:hypothetical protein RUM43_010425 [Polyplax serrata]|uniref:Uncharacterized protein n=1 Tax=Polyplax serrata TaxID=468196 RepID=A0AAN8S0G9_POLSC